MRMGLSYPVVCSLEIVRHSANWSRLHDLAPTTQLLALTQRRVVQMRPTAEMPVDLLVEHLWQLEFLLTTVALKGVRLQNYQGVALWMIDSL